MSDYIRDFAEAIIGSGELCKTCIGNNADCHGDYTCETLEKIIPEVINESMWIPVTERVPETNEFVLVSCKTKKGVKNINRAYYNNKYWHGSGSMSGVEAWMPLPAPYGGDSNEA